MYAWVNFNWYIVSPKAPFAKYFRSLTLVSPYRKEFLQKGVQRYLGKENYKGLRFRRIIRVQNLDLA